VCVAKQLPLDMETRFGAFARRENIAETLNPLRNSA
jgi:hypothetical protein